MNIQEYITELGGSFYEARNSQNSDPMEKYMKNRFFYLGIKAQDRNDLLKTHIKQNGWPGMEDLEELIHTLWENDKREFQYAALFFAIKFKNRVPASFIDLYEYMVVNKSWWDTVDAISSHLIGAYFNLFPETVKSRTGQWIDGENMWLRRSALLFQLKYKNNTDFELMTSYILKSKDDPEFFIRKAIGWVLREYSKIDPKRVSSFIEKTELSVLSRKEGMKWINRV